MKTFDWQIPLRRVGALALALLLALSPLAALAAEYVPPLVFTLEWAEGQQAVSAEVTEPGYEGSYWLYVPQEALSADAQLLVSDTWSQYSQITLADGRGLNGLRLSELAYIDAGAELGLDYLDLLAYGQDGRLSAQIRLYISTQTDTPATPQPQVIETQVPVYYYDSMTGELVHQASAAVRTGDNWVNADDSLMNGYERISDASAYVLVDSNGGCSPSQVEFHYRRQAQPVDVTVSLVDETGSEISRFTRACAPGSTTLSAEPVDGYDIDYSYSTSYDIYVDANGASMTEVTFHYTRKVSAVTVTVVCVDELGNVITSYTQECGAGSTTIAAQSYDGYDLDYNYSTSYDIYVDANGASMTEVTFHYTRKVSAVTVTVVSVDEQGNVITSYTQECGAGSTTIAAQSYDGYDLDYNYSTSYDIYVDANGASMTEITFHYTRKVSAVTVTVLCIDELGNVFSTYSQECGAGTTILSAPAIEGYDVNESLTSSYEIVVDAGGANYSEVTFFYIRQVKAVTVTVWCVDETGASFATYFQDCSEGVTTISAQSFDGYSIDPAHDASYEIVVNADGANRTEVVFYYIKTPAPTDEPTPTDTHAPTAVIVETTVPVLYVDQNGSVFYTTEAAVATGQNTVAVNSDLVGAGYTSYGETLVRVTVDENGACEPDTVVFTFIAPTDIWLHLRDEAGSPVAESVSFRLLAGVNPISAPQVNGYDLADDAVKYVTLDQNGADQQEVVFLYRKAEAATQQPTDTPEPQLALVTVYYRTTTNEVPFYTDSTVKCFTGENTVEPNPSYVPEGYQLVSAASVQVTVDAQGIASPASVEFLYSASNMTRAIQVYYLNESGQGVASPQTVICRLGDQVIVPAPDDLQTGYYVADASGVNVRLEEDGTLIPESVIFTCLTVPPTSAPTVAPVDYPIYDMDAWAFPKGDGTPMRSFPANDTEENIIARVSRADLLHIEGYVVNSLNETWYIATSGDQTGYIRDGHVRLLSQEEINALFGYTAVPTGTPVPTATPIPDGAFIDRWGKLNTNSVNFRETPSTSGKRIKAYNKGQYIFVYESLTVDGKQWYRANTNGVDGYMMAQYIDLMSEADSAAYQATLASPMPVRTAAPSDTPVPTGTPVPTETPVPPPTETPTPLPYSGYALTARIVDLRTGISVGDTTLATLQQNSLVFIYGQVYVDGVCWDSAEALSSGASGYVPDDALRHITAEEAAPYLAALQPQHTETPTPTQRPDLYTGYAVTNGSNVMIRNYHDEKAEIAQVLGEGEVVWIMGQEYVAGSSYYWEIVQFGKVYGYVRNDQLRLMTQDERESYEANLRTPIPSPVAEVTAPPVTQASMSSYGYVTTNNVRLRSGPSTSSTQIRMMQRYAFALVLGSENVNGHTWYRINQAGTEGYVMGDYFKVLSLGELTEFLTSDEYRQAAAETGAASSGGNAGSGITSVEDFNSGVWKNPALVNVTYEPFSNIIATPTPDVEALPTLGPTATPTPTVAALATTNFTNYTTPAPNTEGGGSGWVWVGLAAAAVAVGGGAYGYSIYRANQRRAAQRAAQRRQQQQQQRTNSAYARPSQQPAQPYGQQQYGQQTQQYGQQTQQYAQPPARAQQTSVFAPPTPQQGAAAPQQPTGSTPQQPAQNAPQQPTQNAQQGASSRHRRSDRHQG